MKALLGFAGLVDRINQRVCLIATWFVLLSCLVSAGNAAIRYALNISSNAWLELQWYMFAAIVMLGTSYTLKLNEHVRVDVLYARFSSRLAAWVDLLGAILFLMPAALLIMYMSWPLFWDSYVSKEMSSNAGGLIRWPAKLVIPIGAGLLALQGLSEIIKRIGYLRGQYDMDTHYEKPLQ
jgi:TRAP-type mannitol/chloroaromatic compound transport system permease small subunit